MFCNYFYFLLFFAGIFCVQRLVETLTALHTILLNQPVPMQKTNNKKMSPLCFEKKPHSIKANLSVSPAKHFLAEANISK